jgi:hypothetical protein
MKSRFQSTLLAFLAFGLVMGIYTAFVSRSLATGIVLESSAVLCLRCSCCFLLSCLSGSVRLD